MHNHDEDGTGGSKPSSKPKADKKKNPKMARRKKPPGLKQEAPTGINLTKKADDLTQILARHASIARATILFNFFGRGLAQFLKDGLIQDPSNPTLSIIDQAVEKIFTDPVFQPAINALKAELSIVKFDWEPNGEDIEIEVEEDE